MAKVSIRRVSAFVVAASRYRCSECNGWIARGEWFALGKRPHAAMFAKSYCQRCVPRPASS